MNLMQFPQMLVSTHAGWDEVERLRPEMGTMFLRLVLPLSLLPPLMIVYASTGVGAHVFPDASHETWLLAAMFFFIAEHLSVPLMAGSIRQASIAKGASGNLHDAYMVASISPVPLWLSSLALFLDQPWLVVMFALLALAASGVLIHHGVRRLLRVREDVDATDMAVQVTSLGVLAWLLLVVVGVLPLWLL